MGGRDGEGQGRCAGTKCLLRRHFECNARHRNPRCLQAGGGRQPLCQHKICVQWRLCGQRRMVGVACPLSCRDCPGCAAAYHCSRLLLMLTLPPTGRPPPLPSTPQGPGDAGAAGLLVGGAAWERGAAAGQPRERDLHPHVRLQGRAGRQVRQSALEGEWRVSACVG